jgi:hypothetical protein
MPCDRGHRPTSFCQHRTARSAASFGVAFLLRLDLGLRYNKSAIVGIVVDPATITTKSFARFGRKLLRFEWAEHRDLLPEADDSHLAQQIVDDLHSEFVAQSGLLAWLWQHVVPRVGGELSH